MAMTALRSPWTNARFFAQSPSVEIPSNDFMSFKGRIRLRTAQTGHLCLSDGATPLHVGQVGDDTKVWEGGGRTDKPFSWSPPQLWGNTFVCPKNTWVSIDGPKDGDARITGVHAPDKKTLGALTFIGGEGPVIAVEQTKIPGEYRVHFAKDIQISYAEGNMKIHGLPEVSHYGYAYVYFYPDGRIRSAVPEPVQYADKNKYNGVYLKLSDRNKTSYKFAATAPVTLDENGRIILGTIVLPEHDDTRRKHSQRNTYELESTDIRVTYNDDGSTRIEFGEWKYNWTTEQQEFVLAKEETI